MHIIVKQLVGLPQVVPDEAIIHRKHHVSAQPKEHSSPELSPPASSEIHQNCPKLSPNFSNHTNTSTPSEPQWPLITRPTLHTSHARNPRLQHSIVTFKPAHNRTLVFEALAKLLRWVLSTLRAYPRPAGIPSS